MKIDIEIPKKMSFHDKCNWFQEIIINKQLEKYNLTWEQFKENQKENPNYNIDFDKEKFLTKEEYDELADFGISLLQKLFRWNKKMSQKEWSWFSLNNTLRVKWE